MRKNEYTSLEQFTSQYIGEWNPSEGHWFGLDFIFNDNEYRLSTGYMYEEDLASHGSAENMFYLYQKNDCVGIDKKEYLLLGQYKDMPSLLLSEDIEGMLFREVIMHDQTELVGQD